MRQVFNLLFGRSFKLPSIVRSKLVRGSLPALKLEPVSACGTPFRDAYKNVGHDIEHGRFKPLKRVNHTHEGSIGNLYNKASLNDLNTEGAVYERYRPIIGELAREVYQDTSFVPNHLREDTKVLYSIQKARGHQAILIAGMDDDWVDRVIYRSYDDSGKFVAQVVLYESGGDGGYSTRSFGRFVNDSTYMRTTVECELDFDSEEEKEVCDTVKATYLIRDNGSVERISPVPYQH